MGREIAALKPPGHAGVVVTTGGGLAEKLMWYVHSGVPKSMSIACTVSDAVPTKAIDLKPRYPIS